MSCGKDCDSLKRKNLVSFDKAVLVLCFTESQKNIIIFYHHNFSSELNPFPQTIYAVSVKALRKMKAIHLEKFVGNICCSSKTIVSISLAKRCHLGLVSTLRVANTCQNLSHSHSVLTEAQREHQCHGNVC